MTKWWFSALIFLTLVSVQSVRAERSEDNERFSCDSGTAQPETRAAREGEEIRIYGHGIKKNYSKVEIIAVSCQNGNGTEDAKSMIDLRNCRNIRLVRFFTETGQLTISDRGCIFGLPSELRVRDQSTSQETANLVPESPLSGTSSTEGSRAHLDDEHELLTDQVRAARAARAKWLKASNGFIFPEDATYVRNSRLIVFKNGQWLDKATGFGPWPLAYSVSIYFKAMVGLFF